MLPESFARPSHPAMHKLYKADCHRTPRIRIQAGQYPRNLRSDQVNRPGSSADRREISALRSANVVSIALTLAVTVLSPTHPRP